MSDETTVNAISAHAEHADHYDPVGAKIGMWLFLFTEFLLFGTLFIVFAVYLRQYRFDFQMASGQLDRIMGAANTVILLTSSLTMALSIAALERARVRLAVGMMVSTLLFAGGFLVIKSFEWGAKFSHDIFPDSVTMLQKTAGEQLFYGLYFAMTGLHGLHVVIGAAVIIYALVAIRKGSVRSDRMLFMHNTGLYWHLVSLFCTLLFLLIYLNG